jgi:hypothetical protein
MKMDKMSMLEHNAEQGGKQPFAGRRHGLARGRLPRDGAG